MGIGDILRIRTNNELFGLLSHIDDSQCIKIQRLRWHGHVIRVEENVPAKRIFDEGISGNDLWRIINGNFTAIRFNVNKKNGYILEVTLPFKPGNSCYEFKLKSLLISHVLAQNNFFIFFTLNFYLLNPALPDILLEKLFISEKKTFFRTLKNLIFTKVPTFLKETPERGALCWRFHASFVRK